jgi:hypothetical protein
MSRISDVTTIRDLTLDPRNARKHNARNLGMIRDSLQEVGAARSIVIDEQGRVLAGNGTVEAAASAGMDRVQIVDADGGTIVAVRRTGLTEEQKQRLALWDNRAAETAEWDPDILAALADEDPQALSGLFTPDEVDSLLASLEASEEEAEPTAETVTLAERFGVPPFSVLDARQGYWQERKRAWLSLGIRSELGRGDCMPSGESSVYGGSSDWAGTRGPSSCPGGSPRPAATLGKDGKTQRGDGKGKARCFGQDLMRGEHVVGRADAAAFKNQAQLSAMQKGRLTWVQGEREDLDDTSAKILAAQASSGTSIFDPVLCELAYRWFSPAAGSVLDPFAGGSVRGIVASKLGRRYTGVELRPEQVEANREQGEAICQEPAPVWMAGDSREVERLAPGGYDFLFSCPPYADLERYSDDPADLSTLSYPAFLAAYRDIIAASCRLLLPDRFACFVVGDVRDRKGFYRNFVGDTVAAFADAGLRLYNEAVLVTMVGSLPLRTGKQFSRARKLGKTHQNVLVFVKGDPRKATEACGTVEMGDWETLAEGSAEGAE